MLGTFPDGLCTWRMPEEGADADVIAEYWGWILSSVSRTTIIYKEQWNFHKNALRDLIWEGPGKNQQSKEVLKLGQIPTLTMRSTKKN